MTCKTVTGGPQVKSELKREIIPDRRAHNQKSTALSNIQTSRGYRTFSTEHSKASNVLRRRLLGHRDCASKMFSVGFRRPKVKRNRRRLLLSLERILLKKKLVEMWIMTTLTTMCRFCSCSDLLLRTKASLVLFTILSRNGLDFK